MTDLIMQSLKYLAEHHGDPMRPLRRPLHLIRLMRAFLLDSDEGLRRNMMRTTLEIITTHIRSRCCCQSRIGARMNHVSTELRLISMCFLR